MMVAKTIRWRSRLADEWRHDRARAWAHTQPLTFSSAGPASESEGVESISAGALRLCGQYLNGMRLRGELRGPRP